MGAVLFSSSVFPTISLLTVVTDDYKEAKRRRGLCTVYRCRRAAAKHAARCNTCLSRLYRLRNPTMYAFVALKASAYKRRIGFELTFEEFRMFCAATGYMEKKGTASGCMTVDRRKPDQPYRLDNIRPMTSALNSSRTMNYQYTSEEERPW